MSDDIGIHFDSMEPSMPPAEFCSLLTAARAGDARARDTLVERAYPRVERMVHLALANDLRKNRPWLLARFSTGDVVQEVFRSLIRDLGGFAGDTEPAFVGYLAMVVRNRLLDAIRYHEAAQRDGRRTTQVPECPQCEPSDDREEADTGGREELERFHAVLRTFPERDQLLLRARIEQDVTFEDLAERLGFPSKFAARRAFYAAQALLVIRMRQRNSPGPTEGAD